MSRLFSRRRLIAAGGAGALSAPLAVSRPVSAGTSGSSGALTTLSRPVRVFDSRRPDSVLGGAKFSGGDVVAVTVSGAYDGDEFATAVFANIAVTQTEGGGHLSVTAEGLSGEAPPPETSNINWSTSGVTLANLVLAPVGGEHAIAVHCTGGRTHVIVDIQGYVPFTP